MADGHFVNDGNAYVIGRYVQALVVTGAQDPENDERVKFGVALILSSGKLIPICPADSHEDAKEKLKRWAELF